MGEQTKHKEHWIMKKVAGQLVFITLCLLATSLWAKEKADVMPEDYIIGPGDVLDISVWKNEDLTKSVIVLPDGKFSFPLIGEVVAGGKTVAHLKSELEEKINRYVPDPVLSVIVQSVNSMMIYVIGKVHKPGRFILNANINVLQALSLAGGLNPFAKRGDIRILREEGKETMVFDFDYDAVALDNKLDQNIILKRGDVIVVP